MGEGEGGDDSVVAQAAPPNVSTACHLLPDLITTAERSSVARNSMWSKPFQM